MGNCERSVDGGLQGAAAKANNDQAGFPNGSAGEAPRRQSRNRRTTTASASSALRSARMARVLRTPGTLVLRDGGKLDARGHSEAEALRPGLEL